MPVVTGGPLRDPAGNLLTNLPVGIRLVASTTEEAEGYSSSATYNDVATVYTDPTTGIWTATLTANSLITPPGTFYEITEPQRTRERLIKIYVIVPNGAGPYAAKDILVDPPALVQSPPLAAHEADTTAIHGIADTTALALKPAVGDGIQWATGEGDDANDGLSEGTAKLTIYEAYETLPAGGGTIYVGQNARIGGPVPGQGLRITGRDPAITPIPTGWLQSKPVRIIGVGGNGVGGTHAPATTIKGYGGSTSGWIEPWLWIAEGSTDGIYVENLTPSMANQFKFGVDLARRGLSVISDITPGATSLQVTSNLDATGVGTPPFTAWLYSTSGAWERVTVSAVSGYGTGTLTFTISATTNTYLAGSTLAFWFTGSYSDANVTLKNLLMRSDAVGMNALMVAGNYWLDIIDCSFIADKWNTTTLVSAASGGTGLDAVTDPVDIPVTNAGSLPTYAPFRFWIDSEKFVSNTPRLGNTLKNVARGQEGTAIATHAAGAAVWTEPYDPDDRDRWSVIIDGSYLVNFLGKTKVTYGGILCENSISASRFDNVAGENFSDAIFASTDQPVISLEYPTGVTIGYLESYDSAGNHTAAMVKVRPLTNAPSKVLLYSIGNRNANAWPVDGPAEVHTFVAGGTNPIEASPWKFGGIGFHQDRVFGFHRGHRRAGGPYAVRYPNIVPATDPTSWLDSGTGGTAKAITGKTDPFGGTNAAYIRGTNAAPNNITARYQPFVPVSRTFVAGDIIIWGVWARVAINAADVSPSADAVSIDWAIAPSVKLVSDAIGTTATTAVLRDWTGNEITWEPDSVGQSGEWYWAHGYGYIESVNGGGVASIQMRFGQGSLAKVVAAYPQIHHLTGVSEEEARLELESLQSVSSKAPVGSLGTTRNPYFLASSPSSGWPTPTAGGEVFGADSLASDHFSVKDSAGVVHDLQAASGLSTRRIWVPAKVGPWTLDGSTAVNLGAAPDQIAVIQMADAVSTGAFTTIEVPADATAAQPLIARPVWSATASGNAVRWSADAYILDPTASVVTAGTTTAWTGDTAVSSGKPVFETGSQVLAAVSAGDVVRFNLRRIGADAADTHGGAANLLGVRFQYTSSS